MELCSFRLVFGPSDKPPLLQGRSSVKVLKIVQSTTVIRGDEIESSAVSREGEKYKRVSAPVNCIWRKLHCVVSDSLLYKKLYNTCVLRGLFGLTALFGQTSCRVALSPQVRL